MNSVPEAFRVRTDQLKKNFSNTLHMYRKYWEKYRLMFNYAAPADVTPTSASNGNRSLTLKRKKEKVPCTAKTLYEFCWCLYASIKADMNENVKDLIMTHNLLLCCLDLMYANCVWEGRKDLINPNFAGHQAVTEGGTRGGRSQVFCILKYLADDNPLIEMMDMKRYLFRDALRKLVDTAKLQHDKTQTETPFMGLLGEEAFDQNFRNINKHYDEYVLNNGQIDEKLFLVADNFGVPQHPSQTILGGGGGGGAGGTGTTEGNGLLPPQTPLTRATDSVRKLHSVIGETHTAFAPERIIQLFK